MLLARQHLMPLLNGLYDLGETRLSVSHPSAEIGELLKITLNNTTDAAVTVTTDRYEYADKRDEIEQTYSDTVHEDLPNPQSYVRTLIAGGLFDVANRDDIEQFLRYHGFPDLEAGHDPVMAGLDTNLFGYRMPTVLGLSSDGIRRGRDKNRPPVTGFVLSSGVKSELDWHYKHYDTRELTQAFGDEFERLDNQPAGKNRSGFLGLYEFRELMSHRQTDFAYSETGDADIIHGYNEYMDDHRKEVLLFSNDTGFVEQAIDSGIKAQKVAFPPNVPAEGTIAWETVCDLLYMLAVVFGVIVLPKVTLYGVWNGKDGSHWKSDTLALDIRSPNLAPRVERDHQIVTSYADR